jgi:DNA-binding beta-propeller fold protein YncE
VPGARVLSIDVGGVPTSVVETFGSVWVATGLGGIVRIDAFTNELVGRIRPGGSVSMLARGYSALWAIDVFRGRLLRIDPRTSRVTKAIDVGPLPSGLAIGHGLVWVASQLASTVSGIDPRTGQVEKLAIFARASCCASGTLV